MKVNAYIMAADPAWIEASVRSYYHLVERIVVSYDEDGLGWTGVPLDIEQCLGRLRAIDHLGKLDFRAGHYARPEFFRQPLENDTHQRCCALEAAGQGADWVVQLDTDEVIGNTDTFADCLEEANRRGCRALNYPSLWLYSHAFGGWYLEWCKRGWRRSPSYPGPMAVKSGIPVIHARRIESGHFHVDTSPRGSSARVPNGIGVDRVIATEAAIWHFSAVRDEEWLARKYSASGHAHERDWDPEIQRWRWAARHPLLKTVTSQWERGPYKRPLRLARIPAGVQALIAASCVSEREAGGPFRSESRPTPLKGNAPGIGADKS